MYVYVCLSIFRTVAHFSLRTKHFSAKHQILGHMKPGRTHWSRSRRDPCTLERVASAQSVSFGGSEFSYVAKVRFFGATRGIHVWCET